MIFEKSPNYFLLDTSDRLVKWVEFPISKWLNCDFNKFPTAWPKIAPIAEDKFLLLGGGTFEPTSFCFELNTSD